MYRVCIIMHSKYLGRQQRHSADEVHNTARPYSDLNLLLLFSLFSHITGSLNSKVTLRWRRALSQAPSIYTIVDLFKKEVRNAFRVHFGVPNIALYASAPNHVFGQLLGCPAPVVTTLCSARL